MTGSRKSSESSGQHLCRRGHVMDYVSPGGKRVCLTCHRRRSAKWRAKKKQARLAERRKRIAERQRLPAPERQWAAGHFEGEGTISIASGCKGYSHPHISLTSTDRDVIDFFHARWPGYVRSMWPRSPSGLAKKVHEWVLWSNDQVECFLRDLRPCLRTPRMLTKCDLLLEEIRERVRYSHTPEAKARSRARLKRMRELNRRGLLRPRKVEGSEGG